MKTFEITMDRDSLMGYLKPFTKTADEIQMNFTSKGIHICNLTADHVAVVTSDLKAGCDTEPFSVKASLKRMTDALSAFPKGDVTMRVSEDYIAFETDELTRAMRTDAPEDREPKVPTIEGQEISLAGCSEWIGKVAIGETVAFLWDDMGLDIRSGDEIEIASIHRDVQMDGNGSAIFPTEYLAGFMKTIPKDADVKGTLADSVPIKIDYETKDFKGSILVAPRIEER